MVCDHVRQFDNVTAFGAASFFFSGVPGLDINGPESANFTLSAPSNSLGNCGMNRGAGDSLVQAGYSGTFSFIDTGLYAGANLLSGTFSVTGTPSTTGAQFSSHIGSSGASFDASATLGNLNQPVFTSQFLNFPGETDEDASWSISSLIPNFAVGTVVSDQAYPANGTFNGAGSGTFSSNPRPTTAPEPSSLARLAGGLMGIGFLVRKKAGAANEC